jgi:predicted cupin superfamily sugar epimerase
MNAEAGHLISRFRLVPLEKEGGFYARVWNSPERMAGGRLVASAILFLITRDDFSALHRLGMDEIWHFHAGDPAELTMLDPVAGSRVALALGPDVARAHVPHAIVPAGMWQGARVHPDGGGGRGWTLFGCTVFPGWDEAEFELGRRQDLLREFPSHASIVSALTR